MDPQRERAESVSTECDFGGTWLLDPRQVELFNDLERLRLAQRERALKGERIFDLAMVNPDLPPPRVVLDRLLESVTKTANHRYAVSRGIRRLREAFTCKYQEKFGHTLDPERQVCVCLGSKDATFHALRVLIGQKARVIVSVPSYPAHTSAVVMAGGEYTTWLAPQCPEQAAYSLREVVQQSGARVLLLNFPSNPTGAVASREWWLSIGRVCADFGVIILNDFVYGEMSFGEKIAESALCVGEVGARCLEVYSLSKAYNVPGWRVGALVGDSEVVGTVSRLKAHADYGLFLPLQYAATQALESSDDLVAPTVETYRRRVRVLSHGLQSLGWHVRVPEAGACLWVQYPKELASLCNGSEFGSVNAAQHLLVRGGVMVTPGIVFGAECDQWMRLAVVMSEERLRDVIDVIRELSL